MHTARSHARARFHAQRKYVASIAHGRTAQGDLRDRRRQRAALNRQLSQWGVLRMT